MKHGHEHTCSSFLLHAGWVLLALITAFLLNSCGGGGGGDGDGGTEPPPSATIVLEGNAIDAEHIVLSWSVGTLYTNQAYAITVNGAFYDVTTAKGYLFPAQPQTNYCFTVVVGSSLPPLIPFTAAGPTSNQVCITTPSLPPLVSGWSFRDPGFGLGRFPTIARYSQGYGIFACNAGNPSLWPNELALFGYLVPLYASANTFPIYGNACSAAFDPNLSELHTVIGDGSSIRYLSAYYQMSQWGTSTPVLVANAPGPFSVELDNVRHPVILYEASGHVYLATYASGQWTSEYVGDGYTGWRSLAIAPDGKIYALIGQGDQLHILSRGISGWTTAFTVSGVPSHSTRGSGSIIAHAAGDVRVAFRKSMGGTTMGVGYVALASGLWSESLVTTSTYVTPPAIAVSALGETLISWGDEHLDLRLSRGNSGNWQHLYIDALGELAEQTDIGVDGGGNIFILYSDHNGPAKVAVGQ